MNNKGFTLIELLGVLVILVVIMSIAIPSITSSVERSKSKQREQIIKIVVSAGELYFDKHRSATSVCVPTLISEGYISKEEAKDPLNESSTVCGCVSKSTLKFTEDSSNCNVIE